MTTSLKSFAALAGLAALGCSSLVLSAGSMVETLPFEAVEAAGGRSTLLALIVIQPMVLSLAAIITGLAVAHKAGLHSLIVARLRGDGWSREGILPVALGAGFAAGVLIIGGDLLFSPWTDAALSKISIPPGERLGALAVGILYGGITEEILLRWGVLSFVAWLLLRLGLSRRAGLWLAVFASAVLFAVAHLPALAASTTLTEALVARTLLLNAGAGVIFGLAYVRHSLEAAMAAHAIAHVIIFAGRVAGVAY